MTRLFEGLQLLLLGLWVGGMAGFGAFMAPVLFRLVPSRQLAGNVAGTVIDRLNWLGVITFAVVLAGHWLSRRQLDWRLLAMALALVLTLANATYVRGGLDRVQAQMTQPIEQYAVTDPLRVEYNRWHRLSSNLGMISVVLGAAVLVSWAPMRR